MTSALNAISVIGPAPPKPLHGGALYRASKEFAIAPEHWIDLSTGISPEPWPVPAPPIEAWCSLPDAEDGLIAQAANYYGCSLSEILPISGSQFAIEQIPQLLSTGSVAVPVWGYAEHSYRWQLAGHQLHWYSSYQELANLVETNTVNNAVVINPNNPSTALFTLAELQYLMAVLAVNNGTLVVDEAFMDSYEEHSLCTILADRPCPPELIILRSVGKFFGLAGIRLGFVIASEAFIQRLEPQLSPWAVNHIARWVGQQALGDRDWQRRQRQRLVEHSAAWQTQLKILFPAFDWQRSDCFVTAFADRQSCEKLYQRLGETALLVRLLCSAREGLQGGFQSELDGIKVDGKSDGAALRFGLPALSQQQAVIDRITTHNWRPL
jgi:cobalamin biosynthetic protein CobC|tara:strand:+ start:351 stop:1493 length:1143 start_codon:yes stop_codon:yes gene_type:complete